MYDELEVGLHTHPLQSLEWVAQMTVAVLGSMVAAFLDAVEMLSLEDETLAAVSMLPATLSLVIGSAVMRHVEVDIAVAALSSFDACSSSLIPSTQPLYVLAFVQQSMLASLLHSSSFLQRRVMQEWGQVQRVKLVWTWQRQT